MHFSSVFCQWIPPLVVSTCSRRSSGENSCHVPATSLPITQALAVFHSASMSSRGVAAAAATPGRSSSGA